MKNSHTNIGRILFGLSIAGIVGCSDSGGSGSDGVSKGTVSGEARNYSVKAYWINKSGEKELVEFAAREVETLDEKSESPASAKTSGGETVDKKGQMLSADNVPAEGRPVSTLYEAMEKSPGLDRLSSAIAQDCADVLEETGSVPTAFRRIKTHQHGANAYDSETYSSAKFTYSQIEKYVIGAPTPLYYDGFHRSWYVLSADYIGEDGAFDYSPNGSLEYKPGGVEKVSDVFGTCDNFLFGQSQLVCVASKLAEMAEAVGPVKVGERLIVPPQASRDRFLLRRLEFEALAALAHLGYESVDGATCGVWYGRGLSDPATYRSNAASILGTSAFKGITTYASGTPTETAFKSLLAPRVHLYFEHLRAGERLLHDGIEASVKENLAQAEVLRAERGIVGMWGADDEDVQSAPNSLRGALSTLVGRLEVDPIVRKGRAKAPGGNAMSAYVPTHDPMCGGYASLRDMKGESDLLDAIGNSMAARVNDVPPSTLGQQRALDIIQGLGVVVPVSELDKPLGGSDYRGMVREQLVLSLARKANPGKSASELATEASDIADAYKDGLDAQLDGIQEEDWNYALNRNLDLFVQLTDQGRDLAIALPSAGLVALSKSLEGSKLLALGGKIVSTSADAPSGLTRALLTGDAFAVVSPAIAASGCDGDVRMAPYQGVFEIGRSFQSHIDRVFNVGDAEASLSPTTREVVQSLVSELRSWASGDRVTMQNGGQTSRRIFGAEVDSDEIEGYGQAGYAGPLFTVFYGKSWEAACLAGTRELCPSGSNFAAPSQVWTADPSTVVVTKLDGDRYGTTELKATYTGTAVPDVADGQTGSGRYFYVILRKGANMGRIVGVMRPQDGTVRQHTPPLQRRLLNETFAVAEKRIASDSCLSNSTAGLPANYCIPGMIRDQFVPLANELTSQSGGSVEDSWKHYLSLAKEAAVKADELGRQIIDLGLQRDLRREGAQEELAGLCGTYDVPDLQLSNGVAESSSNTQLNQCISPKTLSVLFLANPEKQGEETKVDEQVTELVKEKFCGSSSTDPICSTTKILRRPDSSSEGVYWATLDFPVSPLAPTASLPSGCDKFEMPKADSGKADAVKDYLLSGKFKKNFIANAANTDALSGNQMGSSVARYRFREHADGNWSLTMLGTVLFAGGTVPPPAEEDRLPHHFAFPYCKIFDTKCTTTGDAMATRFGGKAEWTPERVVRLRRTLESGLAHMGVVSGNLPKEVFDLYVPVARIEDDEEKVPFQLIYGGGIFDPAGSEFWVFNPTGGRFGGDRDVFGTAVNPIQAHVDYRSSLSNQTGYGPTWEERYHPQHLIMRQAKNFAQSYRPLKSNGVAAGASGWVSSAVAADDQARKDSARKSFIEALWGGLKPTGGRGLVWGGRLYSGVAAFHWNDKGGGTSDSQMLEDVKLGDLSIDPQRSERDGGHEAFAFNWFISRGLVEPEKSNMNSDTDCRAQDGIFLNRACATADWGAKNALECNSTAGKVTCAEDGGRKWDNVNDYEDAGKVFTNYTGSALSPTWWPPEDRVTMFVDPGESMEQGLFGAAFLTCLAEDAGTTVPTEVPVVTNPQEIEGLRRFIQQRAETIAEAQRKIFIPNVPDSVVAYGLSKQVPYDAVAQGRSGETMLEMAGAMNDIYSGFGDVVSALRQMSAAVDAAALGLRGEDLSADQAENQVAMQRVNAVGQIAQGIAAAAGGFLDSLPVVGAGGATSPGKMSGWAQVGGGAAQVATGVATLVHLSKEDALNAQLKTNRVASLLQQMGQEVSSAQDASENGMTRIHDGVLSVLRLQNQLKQVAGDAGFEAAKASGADFADTDGDGTPDTAIPVNTVYRRNYDILNIRYKRALEAAKRYGYLARLSIEQRLGVRLDSMRQEVGPLAPPSEWADQLCHLSGVDYQALRTAVADDKVTGGSKESEESIIGEFADQYVGDWIDRLEQFVEFYNVNYPFHEEDDQAVFSVRDELVYGSGVCPRESKNLLYNSGSLWRKGSLEASQSSETNFGGWAKTGCVDATCLSVAGTYLSPGADGAFQTEDDTNEVLLSPSGSPASIFSVYGVSADTPDSTAVAPANSVYQSVTLAKGGYYRLSWNDIARDGAGGVSSTSSVVQVMVSNANWAPIALDYGDAPSGTSWSARRELKVFVPADGVYHVLFSSAEGDSFALADVQLEVVNGELPLAYETTTDTRELIVADCGVGNPKAFRDSFGRGCDETGCFYELSKPITLSELDIARSNSGIGGLAADNYNYRHTSLSLNVVGTGVLDCAGAIEGCNSNGYLEFDFEHSAFNTNLTDHAGAERCFNFGQGAVRHGKALVAERYIGLPLSSSDSGLLSQPAFTKVSLRGRPLSGIYRLRIYESPSLRWENVEDVQVLLNYRYWSRVAGNAN